MIISESKDEFRKRGQDMKKHLQNMIPSLTNFTTSGNYCAVKALIRV